MPVITIASGKGGTGKTTLTVNLAHVLAADGATVQVMDCDVEEPNAQLFIQSRFDRREAVLVPKPIWNERTCIGCGRCVSACAFNALSLIGGRIRIHQELCHACGVCSQVCEHDALREEPLAIGMLESAPYHRPFAFSQGRLALGESQAPAIILALKNDIDKQAITLIDAAPGTACPVVEAMRDSDLVLLVTEPTPFGLHDLRLAVRLCADMRLPTAIVVNRSDGEDRLISTFADEIDLPIAARIPFQRSYAEHCARGDVLVQHCDEIAELLRHMWRDLRPALPSLPVITPVALRPPPKASAAAVTTAPRYQLCVLSGKGGTGKTTITACFSQLAEHHVVADTDVDAADLHLLLGPKLLGGGDFIGGNKAHIDADRCRSCGACIAACRFKAIRPGALPAVDEAACEGCGLCMRICPEQAIICSPRVTGRWYLSQTERGPLVHAELGIGEENSGKLVHRVRQEARSLAESVSMAVIADGPPGTSCPVIASLSGCDLAVLVTEPTVAGVHDLERVLALCEHFNVAAAILINKADLDAGQAEIIRELARRFNATDLGHIPFDPLVQQALMAGRTVLDFGDGPAAQAIRAAWNRIAEILPCAYPEASR